MADKYLYHDLSKHFGLRVKGERKKIGLTQVQLAKKVGVSKTTIQNYESGLIPKGSYLFALSRALKCSIDWLLIFEESPYIKKEFILEKPSGMTEEELLEYHNEIRNKEGAVKPLYFDADPEISELLEEARKVLKSGNKVAQEALESGIRYITQTIDDLENMEETKKRQKNMELRMASLEARLKKSEEIRSEDSPEQQEDILKLRTTG